MVPICICIILVSISIQVKSDTTASTSTTATQTPTTPKLPDISLSYSTCAPKNISSSCSLSCYLDNFSYNNDVRAYSSDFYYYTTDSDNAVRLTFNSPSSSTYLSLSDRYYAGTYECRMSYRSVSTGAVTSFAHAFKIDTEEGAVSASLGDTCSSRQQCATLNADCIDEECKCPEDYYIKFSKGSDNPACLTNVDGSGCNVDAECQYEDIRYRCANGKCMMTGAHNKMTSADAAYVTLATIAIVLAICAIIISAIKKK